MRPLWVVVLGRVGVGERLQLLEQQVMSQRRRCLCLVPFILLVFLLPPIYHLAKSSNNIVCDGAVPMAVYIINMNRINIPLCLCLVVCLVAAEKHSQQPHTEEEELQYLIFTPHCYQSLVANANLTDLDCVKFTFSKLLGYCMVAGGAIVKVPQLIKILVDKSVYGISYPSLILELATNWITIVYNWYRGNSFSIYGENVFIGAQNLLIMAFFVLFIRNVPLSIPKPPEGAYIKYMTLFLLACLTMFFTQNPSAWPPILIQSSMILQIFLFSAARLAQIIHIYRCKSTGSLALISCGLVVLGNLGRLFTVLVEIGDDYLFVFSVILAFILNSTIVAQFFIFWNSDKPQQKKTN